MTPSLGPSFEGHTHTAESITAIKANQPGSVAVQVTDILSGKVDQYISFSEAGLALKTSTVTISTYFKNGNLFRSRYRIEAPTN